MGNAEYMGIIDLFREFASSTSPEEKESAERRRSNYIPTILFLLMSMSECRMEKKAPGEDRGIFGRGELGCVCICGCVYAEMRLSVYVTRFFSRYVSPFFLSLDANLKKTRNCLFLMFFFFIKKFIY